MSSETNQKRSWLDERLDDPKFRELFEQEELSLRFIDQIEAALDDQNLKRSELAAKLGKSRSWVTQALRRGRNLTIKTMVELAQGLDLDLDIVACRRDSSQYSGETPVDCLRSIILTTSCWAQSAQQLHPLKVEVFSPTKDPHRSSRPDTRSFFGHILTAPTSAHEITGLDDDSSRKQFFSWESPWGMGGPDPEDVAAQEIDAIASGEMALSA